MLQKVGLFLLFAISLAANVWLWGYWKFSEQPMWLTYVFLADTLALVFLIVFPLFYFKNTKTLKGISKLWIYRIPYFFVILATVVLAVDSLWWMRKYLIPVQIVLVIVNSILFCKKRGWILSGQKEVSTTGGE